MPHEAYIRNDKEQDARQNPPQSRPCKIFHQFEISRVVCIYPDEDDHAYDRHGGDEAAEGGKFTADLCAYNYNCDTHKQFYKKFHCHLLSGRQAAWPVPHVKGVSFRRNGVTEKSIISSIPSSLDPVDVAN